MPLTVLALVLVVAHSSDGPPSLLNDSARSTSSSNDLTDQVSDRDPAQDVALAAAVGAVVFGAGSALAIVVPSMAIGGQIGLAIAGYNLGWEQYPWIAAPAGLLSAACIYGPPIAILAVPLVATAIQGFATLVVSRLLSTAIIAGLAGGAGATIAGGAFAAMAIAAVLLLVRYMLIPPAISTGYNRIAAGGDENGFVISIFLGASIIGIAVGTGAPLGALALATPAAFFSESTSE